MSKVHVVPQLAKMCIGRMTDGCELYNHSVNHQVHAVSLMQANIVPKYGQFFLSFYYMAIFLQQVFHCCLVCGFQQTSTEFCMYFHCHARDEPVLAPTERYVLLLHSWRIEFKKTINNYPLPLLHSMPQEIGKILSKISSVATPKRKLVTDAIFKPQEILSKILSRNFGAKFQA